MNLINAVHIVFDLKFRNGKRGNGRKRRFRNMIKALNLVIARDAEMEG